MTVRQMADIVRDQDPLMLSTKVTVKEACRHMRDRHVGAVLVTKGPRRLAGIFTGRDAVSRVLAEGLDPTKTTLADVMTKNPGTLSPDRNAVQALRQMQDSGYRHLPIVKDGKIVGIVSHGDFRGLEQACLDEETGLWERL